MEAIHIRLEANFEAALNAFLTAVDETEKSVAYCHLLEAFETLKIFEDEACCEEAL